MGTFLLDGYDPGSLYCELLHCPDNAPLRDRLARLPTAVFKGRAADAERALYNLGITLTVYSDSSAIDRILPFDAIPRVLSAAEWGHTEAGVIQRVTALNLLLDDRSRLVVKPVGEAGGYGITIGPRAPRPNSTSAAPSGCGTPCRRPERGPGFRQITWA